MPLTPKLTKFTTASEAVVTFDWKDITQGNGYIVFQGGVLIPSSETFESYTTGDDSNLTITATTWAAQTFTVGTTGTNEAFYPIKIRVRSKDFGTDRIVMEIQEVTTGEPNGSVMVRFNAFVKKITEDGTNDWFELDIANIDSKELKPLQATTQYALVVQSPTVTDTVRYDNSDGSYTGGQILTTANSGTDWTAQTGDDMLFEIIGSTTNPYILSSADSFTTNIGATAFDPGAASTDVDTEAGTVSFETEFNRSAIIEGAALLDFAHTINNADGSVAKAEIFHVRGTTETSLGTAEGRFNDLSPNLQIDITRQTFLRGDRVKLKLTVGYIDSGTTTDGTIKHDPNTAGNEVKLQLPFKIDL